LQNDPLSNVTITQDAFSTFFEMSECPHVINIPTGIDSQTGEVLRSDTEMQENVYDSYD